MSAAPKLASAAPLFSLHHPPHGAPRATREICDRRIIQVRRWLDQGRTGPWIVQEAVRRWGHTRRSVQRYLRKARKQLGLLLPPKSLADNIRRDGKSYSPRVDALTFRRRVTLVMEWIAAGLSGHEATTRAMKNWGIQRPQAYRYICRAYDDYAFLEERDRLALRLRAVARCETVAQLALDSLKSPRRTETLVYDNPDGSKRRVVTRDDITPAEAMQMWTHAVARLDRLEGLDFERKQGRKPGATSHRSAYFKAARQVDVESALDRAASKLSATRASSRCNAKPAKTSASPERKSSPSSA